MNAFVTGAAGFIGSHLVDRLLADGCRVIAYDNLSTGRQEFLHAALRHPYFRFERGTILDAERLRSAMRGADTVFHLAANADVRFGIHHPRKDLEQNTIGTYTVLEAMRSCGVRRLVFASTASVYGDARIVPTSEDCPFPIATSLYGASKVAAEAAIEAYCASFDLQSFIFRFVSILGPRYTHGHVFDFYSQLREHPDRLYVLGDVHQRKSYLQVSDCVEGILCALKNGCASVNRLNLGADEWCEVNQSVRWITEYLRANPTITYAGGDRGWIGDSRFVFLDCTRLRSYGWRPRRTIREAVVDTLEYLSQNSWAVAAAAQRNDCA